MEATLDLGLLEFVGAALLFGWHFARALLHLQLEEQHWAIEASRNQALGFQRQRDEFKNALDAYQNFDMRLDDARAEFNVVEGSWQAMVTVSHTGKRSLKTTVEIADLAPVGRDPDSSFAKHVRAPRPWPLYPKNSHDANFDLHTQAPEDVDRRVFDCVTNERLPARGCDFSSEAGFGRQFPPRALLCRRASGGRLAR